MRDETFIERVDDQRHCRGRVRMSSLFSSQTKYSESKLDILDCQSWKDDVFIRKKSSTLAHLSVRRAVDFEELVLQVGAHAALEVGRRRRVGSKAGGEVA